MGYKYTINIHDEDGEMLVEHELTSDEAILIVARALADTKRQKVVIPGTPPMKAKKQYKKRTQKPEQEGGSAEESSESHGEKSPRIKELLKKGLDDNEIVNMVGTSLQLVKYHRKAMTARGELDN